MFTAEHTAILLIHRYVFPDALFSLTTLSQEIMLKAEKLATEIIDRKIWLKPWSREEEEEKN